MRPCWSHRMHVPALAEALLVAATDAATRDRLIAAGTVSDGARSRGSERAGNLRRSIARWPSPCLKARAGTLDVQTSTHAVGSSGRRFPADAGHGHPDRR